MALMREYNEAAIRERCRRFPGVHEHVFFAGRLIDGSVFADCGPCALRKGLPSWPGAGLALVVPCDPRDVYLECRNERKRREGGQ